MTVPSLNLIAENEVTALRILTEALQKITEVLKIVVFGSRIRGDFRESSDMDVMVIIRNMEIETKNAVVRILHDVELQYDVPISPVIYTRNEYEMNKRLKSNFIEQVENEGIVLYDSERNAEGRPLAI